MCSLNTVGICVHCIQETYVFIVYSRPMCSLHTVGICVHCIQ